MIDEKTAQLYSDICKRLDIKKPPKLDVIDKNKISKKTLAVRYKGEIFITQELSHDLLSHILVHEITHEVLDHAGYRSVGHGGPFLATYQVFLNKCGLKNDNIETCARDNWSYWVLWRAWYRHVSGAISLVANFEQENPHWLSIEAGAIAEWMLKKWPYPRWLKPNWARRFLQHRYHDFIADRRAILLLTRAVAITLTGLGFGLLSLGQIINSAWTVTIGVFLAFAGITLMAIVGFVRRIRKDLHPAHP